MREKLLFIFSKAFKELRLETERDVFKKSVYYIKTRTYLLDK